jgi:hypothetical protein
MKPASLLFSRLWKFLGWLDLIVVKTMRGILHGYVEYGRVLSSHIHWADTSTSTSESSQPEHLAPAANATSKLAVIPLGRLAPRQSPIAPQRPLLASSPLSDRETLQDHPMGDRPSGRCASKAHQIT